jgi:hypothetical protein
MAKREEDRRQRKGEGHLHLGQGCRRPERGGHRRERGGKRDNSRVSDGIYIYKVVALTVKMFVRS